MKINERYILGHRTRESENKWGYKFVYKEVKA